MNRNRYLNKIWQKENEGIPRGKKGIKSKSIEKTKNINFDEDSEFDIVKSEYELLVKYFKEN